MSKPLDETLSVELSKRIKSKAKTPFDNAYKAALLTEECMYVQGFLVWDDQPYKPIEHGWLELDNCIVDPTLPHFNKNPQELYYFPAQRLTIKKLIAAVEEAQEDYPEDDALPVYDALPHEYYGNVMMGGKNYLEAYNEAQAKCKELNKPKKKTNLESEPT
ncbi:hypothetical protein H6F78_09665 [Coleofasciculus sp. FACHB-64]|uniref:hypothetical protein n=1 Tax=Cyanophyceae TaxID=3028117 RepID=UPI001689FC45|nr:MULTISPECIES: hypothetical protein [unclassified Coleofasciculus]MBD1838628.1 hypothetical protein [Coleofasciculus sp. FACHB-501]MBD2045863.1 hypothetical protein [Coleofasciculus sp. FACHB-64]